MRHQSIGRVPGHSQNDRRCFTGKWCRRHARVLHVNNVCTSCMAWVVGFVAGGLVAWLSQVYTGVSVRCGKRVECLHVYSPHSLHSATSYQTLTRRCAARVRVARARIGLVGLVSGLRGWLAGWLVDGCSSYECMTGIAYTCRLCVWLLFLV